METNLFKDSGVGVPDMIVFDDLSQETILKNLKTRYNKNIIYVGYNSFSYTTIQKYPSKKHHPHVFSVAEAAFTNVSRNNENQSIIVSGESGAGKTESAKHILQYLTSVAGSSEQGDSWVEQRILEANEVLESFGNAKTLKNNNSSRFGKFIHLHFDRQSKIVGASVENYLLEKSRIIRCGEGERGYHIFYEFLKGANKEETEKYLLESPETFSYLNMSSTLDIPQVDDSKNFEQLKISLQVLKFSNEELDYVFRTLAAILWLGNVFFQENKNGYVTLQDEEAVDAVSKLLDIEKKTVTKFLLEKKLVIRSDVTNIPYNQTQAIENRDSTAKSLYTILFEFITNKMNFLLKGTEKHHKSIGILDIFGFECFNTNNSFEQLCINYTNEKLQQNFNQVIFKLEQQEYEAEGVSLEFIKFHDNQPCLDLIESKPMGILFLLDEESRLPRGTDKSWFEKIKSKWSQHKDFGTSLLKKSSFSIHHYAGEVSYEIEAFLDKNRDYPSENIINFLGSSQVSFMAKIMQAKEPEFKNTKQTISIQFRGQLAELVNYISGTSIHYIRCIKPNSKREQFKFDDEMVMTQLQYTGMMETIKIRRSGYPKRLVFSQFISTYDCLLNDKQRKMPKETDKCDAIFAIVKASKQKYTLGKTKVFMKEDIIDTLDDAKLATLQKCIVVIQKIWKGYVQRIQYKKSRKAALIIQKHIRGLLARQQYRKKMKSIIIIQSAIRAAFARDYRKELERKLAEEKEIQSKIVQSASNSVVASPLSSPVSENGFEKLSKLMEEEELKSFSSPLTNLKTDKKRVSKQSIFDLVSSADQQTGITSQEPSPLSPNHVSPENKSPSVASAHSDTMVAPHPPVTPLSIDTHSIEHQLTVSKACLPSARSKPEPIQLPVSGKTIPREMGSPFTPGGRSKFNNPLIKSGEFSPILPEKYPLEEWASKYINMEGVASPERVGPKPINGQNKDILSSPDKENIESYLRFSRRTLTRSLTKLEKLNHQTLAIDISKDIVTIVTLKRMASTAISLIRKIVGIGLSQPEMRDEIFIQLIKASRCPLQSPEKWPEIEKRGWHALTIVSSSFPPSKDFARYFVSYLKESRKSDQTNLFKTKCCILAEDAVRTLSLNGPRQELPSTFEILSVWIGTINFPFWFLDDTCHVLQLHGGSTHGDIVRELVMKGMLTEGITWSLYQTNGQRDLWLRPGDYFMDVISIWENMNPGQADISNFSPTDNGNNPQQVPYNITEEYKFCLRRRIFKNIQLELLTGTELRLLYAQTVIDILRDYYQIPEEYLIRMSGLNLRILCPPNENYDKFLKQKLHTFVPLRMLSNEDYWHYRIVNDFQEHWSQYNVSAAIQEYMILSMSLRHWGWHFFLAFYRGTKVEANRMIVGISSTGIEFASAQTRETLMFFDYKQVRNYDCVNDMIMLTVMSDQQEIEDLLDSENNESYQFSCDQAEDLIAMLREYHPLSAAALRASNLVQQPVVDQDTLRKDIFKVKEILILSGILYWGTEYVEGGADSTSSRKGSVAALSVPKEDRKKKKNRISFMPGLSKLIKSSSNKNAKDRLSSISSLYISDTASVNSSNSNFDDPNGTRNKIKLKHPLTRIAFSEADVWALDLNAYLISLVQKDVRDPFINISPVSPLPAFIRFCFNNNGLVDEMFLQLIRFLNESALESGIQNTKIWQVICICVGCLVPSATVSDYAKAVIRKISYTVPNRWNQSDIVYAKFCSRLLQKMQNIPRKVVPTFMEMSLLARMNPLKIKIAFSDRQSRTIAFETFNTVQEIIDKIGKILQINDLSDYSLYRLMDGREIRLNEKNIMIDYYSTIADLVDFPHEPFIVFRRRVLKNRLPLNSVEYNLLADLSLLNVKRGYIPIQLADVCRIASLATQYQFGDQGGGKVNYLEVINQYVPVYYATEPGLLEKMAVEYTKLKGISKEMALDQIMKYLEVQPEFGGHGFYVQQTFKKDIPKDCVMVVNKKGIHIIHEGKSLLNIPIDNIKQVIPNLEGILVITGRLNDGEKFMFNSPHDQGYEIAEMIADYQGNLGVYQPRQQQQQQQSYFLHSQQNNNNHILNT